MGDTRENQTVAGSENSIYASQGGYAGATEADSDQGLKGQTGENQNRKHKPEKISERVTESRQEAQATIRNSDDEDLK